MDYHHFDSCFFTEGVCEIWLTSEDTGAYGKDIGVSITELLWQLVEVIPEGCRMRIGMTNPPYILEHLEVRPSVHQILTPSDPQTFRSLNLQTLKPSPPQTIRPSDPRPPNPRPSNPRPSNPRQSNPKHFNLTPSNPQTLTPSDPQTLKPQAFRPSNFQMLKP